MRRLASVAAAVFLAGCGGGGSGSVAPAASPTTNNPTTAKAPAPKTGPTATPANANRTAVATGNLTITFPAGFHHATSSSTARKPAYVNPGPFYLDVWVVNGTNATHVVDSSGGSNVNSGNGGLQTLSVPLFSSGVNQIVAYETTNAFGSYNELLAIGEADINSVTAGSSPQITLTMQMNAQRIGVMSDPDDANNDAVTGSTYYSYGAYCVTPFTISPLYFFAADLSGGFVDVGGVGGTTQPTVVNVVSDNPNYANTLGQSPGVGGAYNVTVNDPSLSGVSVTLGATNPAYPIGYNVVSTGYPDGGSYPGLATMYYYTYDYYLNYNLYYSLYSQYQNSPPGGITNTINILPANGC